MDSIKQSEKDRNQSCRPQNTLSLRKNYPGRQTEHLGFAQIDKTLNLSEVVGNDSYAENRERAGVHILWTIKVPRGLRGFPSRRRAP